MTTPDWRDRFVEHLEKLRDQENRGALATLRRGLGYPPGTVPEMYSYVVPWVPTYRNAEDSAFLLAALFAFHSQSGGQGTLGAAFARIATLSDSIEQRFVAVLNCHRDDLSHHLRHAVSLLRSKDVPIDWKQLLRDVLAWDHDDRYVQRNWARDFWRSSTTDEDTNVPDSE